MPAHINLATNSIKYSIDSFLSASQSQQALTAVLRAVDGIVGSVCTLESLFAHNITWLALHKAILILVCEI
jgi:hypothetical protein